MALFLCSRNSVEKSKGLSATLRPQGHYEQGAEDTLEATKRTY